MSEVELVVSALMAGATAGVTSATSSAVQDSYTAFREAVRNRLRAHGQGDAAVLDARAAEPAQWREQLRDALSTAGVAQDEEIIAAARALVRSLEQRTSGDHPELIRVHAPDAKGIVNGNGAVQINTFN